MCWRTASGLRSTSNPPPTRARRWASAARKACESWWTYPRHSVPENPKTSPLRTVRLSRSTATKLPNRFVISSITTAFVCSIHGWRRPACHSIHKQILDRWRDLLDGIERDPFRCELRLELRVRPRHRQPLRARHRRSAPGSRCHLHVRVRCAAGGFSRGDRQHILLQLGFQVCRRIGEQ